MGWSSLLKWLFGCTFAGVIAFVLIAVILFPPTPSEYNRLHMEFKKAEKRANAAEAEVREIEAKIRLKELK